MRTPSGSMARALPVAVRPPRLRSAVRRTVVATKANGASLADETSRSSTAVSRTWSTDPSSWLNNPAYGLGVCPTVGGWPRLSVSRYEFRPRCPLRRSYDVKPRRWARCADGPARPGAAGAGRGPCGKTRSSPMVSRASDSQLSRSTMRRRLLWRRPTRSQHRAFVPLTGTNRVKMLGAR